ncbi:hypothetical protein AAVH_20896 [Aphelenchoides avenae]|nr:hypothetical protein AAVH_20896 [Aphelenchus avenae]
MTRVLAWLLLAILAPSSHADLPLNITSTSGIISELNQFMESRFAGENTSTLAEWNAALPSAQEREEMMRLVSHLYELDDFSQLPSDAMTKFPTLAKSMELSVLEKGRYCVIHERVPPNDHRFPRFFGYTVLQGRRYASRLLHHSAAHFESDGNVCNQSAALFERTQSRSLVVAGASRYAVIGFVLRCFSELECFL